MIITMKQLTSKQRHFIEWVIAATSNQDGMTNAAENVLLTALHTGEYSEEFGTAVHEIMDKVKPKYIRYLNSEQCHTTITK
jgi:hypothetical protein